MKVFVLLLFSRAGEGGRRRWEIGGEKGGIGGENGGWEKEGREKGGCEGRRGMRGEKLLGNILLRIVEIFLV